MLLLKHRKIDILKMDIEGAEYAVIDDLEQPGQQVVVAKPYLEQQPDRATSQEEQVQTSTGPDEGSLPDDHHKGGDQAGSNEDRHGDV